MKRLRSRSDMSPLTLALSPETGERGVDKKNQNSKRMKRPPLTLALSPGGVNLSFACVRNTRSPHTTGVELPPSGSFVFHVIFSVADHFAGRSVSVVTPSPVGPRHAGQFPAAEMPDKNASAAKMRAVFMALTVETRPWRNKGGATPSPRA